MTIYPQPSYACLEADWDEFPFDDDALASLIDHPLGLRAGIATGEAFHG